MDYANLALRFLAMVFVVYYAYLAGKTSSSYEERTYHVARSIWWLVMYIAFKIPA